MSRFVFLDRDGTLTRDEGYTHRLADYALLPGVVPALRRLARAGFQLAVITNQSGIGRGYFRTEDYEAFQRHLCEDLASQGVKLAGSYFCPHLPDDGCACRKPGTALLLRARDELGARLAESWMIGDGPADVLAGRRAGCRGTVWLCAGEAAARGVPDEVPRAPDLATAADIVLSG